MRSASRTASSADSIESGAFACRSRTPSAGPPRSRRIAARYPRRGTVRWGATARPCERASEHQRRESDPAAPPLAAGDGLDADERGADAIAEAQSAQAVEFCNGKSLDLHPLFEDGERSKRALGPGEGSQCAPHGTLGPPGRPLPRARRRWPGAKAPRDRSRGDSPSAPQASRASAHVGPAAPPRRGSSQGPGGRRRGLPRAAPPGVAGWCACREQSPEASVRDSEFPPRSLRACTHRVRVLATVSGGARSPGTRTRCVHARKPRWPWRPELPRAAISASSTSPGE